MNKGLRGGSPSDLQKWQPVIDDADAALAKLQDTDLRYIGESSRGATFSDAFIAENFPVNGTFSDKAFMSSSSDPNTAFVGNTTISIKGRSGVDISEISAVGTENEVLFRPGTKFKVVSNTKVDGHNYISLEEI